MIWQKRYLGKLKVYKVKKFLYIAKASCGEVRSMLYL